MKENELLEQQELRNKMIERVDVLDKVKELLLFSNTDLATTKLVSNFFNVEESVIRQIVSRYNDELQLDGIKNLSGKEVKENFLRDNMSLKTFSGGFELDNCIFANRGNVLFPRRAILRIGMLLRDSEVAKEVRTQLLNIEEKTTVSQKLEDLNEEQKLQLELGIAVASGNTESMLIATTNLMDFKNRHINRLKEDNTRLSNDNKALSKSILEWEDRSKLNYAVRRLALNIHEGFGKVWNQLYVELKYKYHIDLKARGTTPYIQYVKENEWEYVIKSFSAICETNNISASDMFRE